MTSSPCYYIETQKTFKRETNYLYVPSRYSPLSLPWKVSNEKHRPIFIIHRNSFGLNICVLYLLCIVQDRKRRYEQPY